MQPDRFTVKSQEAIQTAQRLAAASKNPEITPAHLLVALLEQEEGLVPAVLNKLGADLPSIKSRARQAMSDLPVLGEGASADPRPSSALSDVLRRSEGEMAQMGDEYVSTEHMLLAIADSKSQLADLLPDRYVSYEAVVGRSTASAATRDRSCRVATTPPNCHAEATLTIS